MLAKSAADKLRTIYEELGQLLSEAGMPKSQAALQHFAVTFELEQMMQATDALEEGVKNERVTKLVATRT